MRWNPYSSRCAIEELSNAEHPTVIVHWADRAGRVPRREADRLVVVLSHEAGLLERVQALAGCQRAWLTGCEGRSARGPRAFVVGRRRYVRAVFEVGDREPAEVMA